MPSSINNSKAGRAPSTSEESFLDTLPDPLLTPILDAMSEGVSVHSASGEILWANGTLCDIYRKSISELKGLNCRDVFHEDGPACPHEQVVTTGSAAQLTGGIHVSGRSFSVTVEPLLDERNKACGFMRVICDVTSERDAQEQLLKAERFASLGQLLSGVAHDVGTPLNVISGYAEYLLMRTAPGGQGYKELSAILDQTRRIAEMFSRALDLARPPQGRTDAIEIRSLLADSLDLVGHHFRRMEMKAALTCRMPPPLVYGEAPQLKQAFFNLLLNAGQQLGTGGRLQVVIEDATDNLRLALFGTEASGVGHDFSRSFAGFVSGEGALEASGIGLYLARKILYQAGARIGFADGDEGVGLMIYLPLKPGGRA